MKPITKTLSLTLLLLMGLLSGASMAQKEKDQAQPAHKKEADQQKAHKQEAFEEEIHEIRLMIRKELEGKMKKIDTILRVHADSMRTYWYWLDHERLDSLREGIQRKMEEIDREYLREVRKEMERIRPQMERLRDSMERIRPKMKRFRDSMERQRIEVIIPRMRKLDSLRKEGLKIDLDSLHHKMIIRMDSLGVHELDVDVQVHSDSIRRIIRESLRHIDSLNIEKHLKDLSLEDHINAAMHHARAWIDEGDFTSEADRSGADLEHLNGKVLKIKTNSRGKVVKVIILSPDGETLEVKEGKEARDFMTREGEKVEISEVE